MVYSQELLSIITEESSLIEEDDYVYFHITTEDYAMSRGHKAPKLMETTNDYIRELPNDILRMIPGKLDLKDAVKTSILSKRWKYIWINHPDLVFNHLNVFGLDRKKLAKDSVGADNMWISCALRKGVETIDLDFLKLHSIYLSSSFQKCYNFPWLLTISEDKGTLKHHVP
ncbi:F-box/FBD/LRR-repeat protein At1g13570-like [Impatiens glandulifera]|uniref:F-box/FBD/LRR-repeat protein At1g13570-like n=1 Tax=Impatiens glandulifera TaxID=253017 RepID=UPI001FB14BDA|nr:F-box/FBD/LRR-repeat protein At1g13570-like [Impatiens glandulifera]